MHILKAFAKSLDAHSSYFTPEEAFEMRAALEKQFEGIGIVLKEGVDGVFITDLIKGGPAERSGKIFSRDQLIAIDGKSILDSTYEEILLKLQGNGKKEIILGLRHLDDESKEQTFEVELKREKIVLNEERLQVHAERFGEGLIGKLTLPSFYESDDDSSCEKDLKEAIRNLKRKGDLRGIILDLRFNAGGFLNQAVKVAGLFITNGVIVISKYAQGEVQYLRDLDGRSYYNGPMLILTSRGSASAAEIVAQALQDYGVALVVGDERTYGKGTIQYQTVTDSEASSYFKVTVGKYYTVSGRSTQIDGVCADIVVPTEYAFYDIGERFLEYPLKNDQVPSAYIDPLNDVDPLSRLWFQKNYLPNLQKKESAWTKMLPDLKRNSTYRLSHDPNFKFFLNAIETSSSKKTFDQSEKENWGFDDLQMAEGVNILKDMILLQSTAKH